MDFPVSVILGISSNMNLSEFKGKILMSAAFKQIIESIRALSADERALIAHCLISSLESRQDEGVDEAWAELAEKRYLELQSGVVTGLLWKEVKNAVKNRDA